MQFSAYITKTWTFLWILGHHLTERADVEGKTFSISWRFPKYFTQCHNLSTNVDLFL